MPSLLALSGLLFDRSFPELGAEAAERRRSAATTLLLGAIGQARETQADALLLLGGLFDERLISPRSVELLVQILDAYPGQVLIATGVPNEGTYGSITWGPRSFQWSSAHFAPAPDPFGAVFGRATQRGHPTTLREEIDGTSPAVLVDVGLSDESAKDWVGLGPGRHVITTGPNAQELDGVTVLAPVNPVIGEKWGQAALVTFDNVGATGVRWTSLTTAPDSQTVELDVSTLSTTADLLAAVDSTAAGLPEWSLIKLVGELPHGVLLPNISEYARARDDVSLNADAVSFGFTPPEQDDHTALAEFVRSLNGSNASDRDRHQAIALGIAALQPSDGTGQ